MRDADALILEKQRIKSGKHRKRLITSTCFPPRATVKLDVLAWELA
jgi:hypothetical protein